MSARSCLGCGCTQNRACPGGCDWIDIEYLICTACSGTMNDVDAAIKFIEKNNTLSRFKIRGVLRSLKKRIRKRATNDRYAASVRGAA